MVMQLSIRQCESGDISDLNQFVKSAAHLIENQYFESAFKEQLDNKRIIFLAFVDNVLAGYVHLNFHPLYAPFSRLNIPEIQDLFVLADYRRQGIGAMLIRAFEARAQTYGCTVFYLETFNFQAPGLYRSLGYEVAYEHAVYPHGIVKYIMVKNLAVAPVAP